MGDADGAVDITSMVMYVRKVKPMPGVMNRVNQMLNTTTAKYPIRRVEVKSFTIPTGTRSKITDNVFAGQLPKRVFVGLVENAAYNGALDKNPFHFRHFDVSKVDVTLNGESQASRPFEPKFGAEKLYLRSYMSLYQTLGRIDDDWYPSISYEEYGDGFTLWGYDFTTDQNAHEDQFHLLKTGNMCIELQFNTALTQTINCIVYAEFDNVVEINKQREVNHDYWAWKPWTRINCTTFYRKIRTWDLTSVACILEIGYRRVQRDVPSSSIRIPPIDRENIGCASTSETTAWQNISIRTDYRHGPMETSCDSCDREASRFTTIRPVTNRTRPKYVATTVRITWNKETLEYRDGHWTEGCGHRTGRPRPRKRTTDSYTDGSRRDIYREDLADSTSHDKRACDERKTIVFGPAIMFRLVVLYVFNDHRIVHHLRCRQVSETTDLGHCIVLRAVWA